MKPLRDSLNNGEFAITAEVAPPKGADASAFMEKARLLKPMVNAINVTDNQGAVMRMSSLAACSMLASEGIDAVFQATCRDRNRLALQSDLLGAFSLGIKNVLALTGDYITMGDHPSGKAVFDIDSTHLLQTTCLLNQGIDMADKKLEGNTDLFPGAVVNPASNPLEPQLMRFEKKIKAGARFFQTQAVFDTEGLKRVVHIAEKRGVKVLTGVLLLKSAAMARFMNSNIPGVTVPDRYIEMLDNSLNPLQTGMEIAASQIDELRNECHGIHIMAMGREEKIIDIMQMSGL
ncbi:MAG: methylenetetrahydrofolate reductase [bacterium]|nr:methylenetetrahydrofolate reductase [bacterium]